MGTIVSGISVRSETGISKIELLKSHLAVNRAHSHSLALEPLAKSIFLWLRETDELGAQAGAWAAFAQLKNEAPNELAPLPKRHGVNNHCFGVTSERALVCMCHPI